MLPIERFLDFVKSNKLFCKNEKILLAVSSGKDSVLMAEFFNAAGISFGIAHCNFQLRGEDSVLDEEFAKQLADSYRVPFYFIRFNTERYAEEQHISIQMAARELRYEWFEQIRSRFNYQYVALAHHKNDAAETMLLNLVRGTGISGLHGILPKRNLLIRPLLFLTAAEIAALVEQNAIAYREDVSNSSTKYARNKIRLEVIPKLKELNPALEQTFTATAKRFAELEELISVKVKRLQEELFIPSPQGVVISIEKLKALRPLNLLVYELFKEYNFSEPILEDLSEAFEAQPGKVFESATHRLLLDRGNLLLSEKETATSETVSLNKEDQLVFWNNNKLKITNKQASEVEIAKDPKAAFLDASFLIYPIQVRSWKEGDFFYPLGMKGKKKLSDFFTGLKIPRLAKSEIPVLINGNNEIMWVAGYRIDERYKVKPATEKVTIFELVNIYGE
ncbi:tRNA lysidine(34) synthetase TilS [Rubrolithibacter danxiaensis]|uniref:tRNA lysidine(34) synthetase TilS n=1 Tax=Rubrolithibacter danxiaensis TaxID=3390805 RepID=UPI003BF88C86